MDQTYETRRRSGKNGSSEPRKSRRRAVEGHAPETQSRTEKNMSKKKAAKSEKPQGPSVARESEYEGHPVIGLYKYADDKYPLSFGAVKAGLILAHVEDIRAFVAKHSKQEANAAA